MCSCFLIVCLLVCFLLLSLVHFRFLSSVKALPQVYKLDITLHVERRLFCVVLKVS